MIETPPEEPSTPAEPPERGGRDLQKRGRRYGAMETHELLTLIDEIDDERSRAQFREAVYLAVILWLTLLLAYIFLPRWLPHRPVLIVQDQRNPKELTYLDTPPDLAQRFKNHPSPRVSERATEAQSPKPTKEPRPPEPKAGSPRPPAPKPTPQPQQQQPRQQAQPQPQQPAPQQPQPQQQARPTPTPRPNTPPLPDTPAPSAQKTPNFGGQRSAGAAIADAARGARNGGDEAGDYGSTGRGNTGAGKAGVQVLSDMQGVDFGRYLARLLADVRRNWLPLIPEECNSPLFKQGITGVRFTIQPDGTIRAQEMHLDYSTHDVAIDRAAWGSIKSLGQAAPLPKEFHGPNLELRIEFRVNKDRDVQ